MSRMNWQACATCGELIAVRDEPFYKLIGNKARCLPCIKDKRTSYEAKQTCKLEPGPVNMKQRTINGVDVTEGT